MQDILIVLLKFGVFQFMLALQHRFVANGGEKEGATC